MRLRVGSERSGGAQAISSSTLGSSLGPHCVSLCLREDGTGELRGGEGEEKTGCHTEVLEHTGQMECVSMCLGTYVYAQTLLRPVQLESALVKTRFFSFPWGHRTCRPLCVCPMSRRGRGTRGGGAMGKMPPCSPWQALEPAQRGCGSHARLG